MTDQHDDATYDAYLLRSPDGSWLAQLADLPGAYATGASQEEAVARLTAAIPAYFAWLRQHDEYTPITHDTPHVASREAVEAPSGQGLGAFFSGDAASITEEDLDWWLAALDWAYGDLLEQAQRTPASSTRDMLLAAVALAQRQTVARAIGAPEPTTPGAVDALAQLAGARDAALTAFRATSAEQRAVVREANGQRWSVRRGLRESALLARRATEALAAMQG